MSNPLQPKAAKVLQAEYEAFVVIATGTTRSGIMDIVACIKGLFYGFEIKWKNDVPSELQKQKINALIDAGGRGYFVRSIDELRAILDNDLEPWKYDLKDPLFL